MSRIEKTIFISYRRKDVYTALAVYENMKNQGYDIFFDYRSIASGDFEQVISSNIRARAHFLLILTPTALDRCNEPGDWLRREIELAIDEKRNIVPLFFKGFRFGGSSKSGVSKWLPFGKPDVLTGKLGNLPRYNGLNVHEDYFEEGMNRLQTEFLSKPLDTVLHPVSTEVQKVVEEEKLAADEALKHKEVLKEPEKRVEKKELPPPVIETEKKEVRKELYAADKVLKQREVFKNPVNQAEEKPVKEIPYRLIAGVGGALAIIILLVWGGLIFFDDLANNTPADSTLTVSTQSSQPGRTATPFPTNTGIIPASATASPTSTCYALSFVKDVTIPDGMIMKAGQEFTKTWKVKNTGSCAWDVGFKFVHVSGDSMNGVTHFISSPVAAGDDYEVSIRMIAPTKSGTVRGTWRISTTSDIFFGGSFFVDIEVSDVSALDIGSTMTGEDGMTLLYIPAGEFMMGSEDGGNDEKPVHTVYLDAFWIDQTEVTNAMFVEFLNQQGNQTEGDGEWFYAKHTNVRVHLDGNIWKIDAGYEGYPIIEVSWYGANAYCSWVGRRLLTEAEWEKAARGTDASYIYPWGQTFDGDLLNFCDINCSFEKSNDSFDDGYAETSPVGNYPYGASPYGVLDMAGNVWEWVSDWFDSSYYQSSPSSNPQGPTSGQHRVLRGGAWFNSDSVVRSTYRTAAIPKNNSLNLGVRCAMDAE